MSTLPARLPFSGADFASNRVPQATESVAKWIPDDRQQACSRWRTQRQQHIIVVGPFDRDPREILITTQSPRNATATSGLQPVDDHIAEALIFRGQDELSKIRKLSRLAHTADLIAIELGPPAIRKSFARWSAGAKPWPTTTRDRPCAEWHFGRRCRIRAAFAARAPQFDGADITAST
jgi:hypothetical protein